MPHPAHKRILILTANYGQGHMSAAKAIQQGLKELYKDDIDVEIVDFARILNKSLNTATKKLYEEFTKLIPTFYKFFFESTDKKWQIKLLNLINYPFCAAKLKKFFEQKKPDVVISTFPIWDYIAIKIWKKDNQSAKFISIVTDSISIHNAWATANTDYYIVANNDTTISLKKLGIKQAKIKVLGFPVRLDFLAPFNRKTFLKKHKLNIKRFTLLFLPTAESNRKCGKIMEELLKNKDTNIIVVTGKNLKLKKKLEEIKNKKNLKIFGWTDELPNFIRSADIVITKAGGATVMECIAAKKPMVITQIIPGQESGNAELIKRYQLGIIPSFANMSINESIDYIRLHPARFQKNLAKLSNPEASLKIAEFIQQVIGKD